MRAALKALSYPDLDIPKNYEIERAVINATHVHLLKPFYKTWDHKFNFAGTDLIPQHDIPVRIYSPDGGVPNAAIIFYHGGGWVTGNIDTYDKVCSNMARITGRLVISVDYLLAPEYPFPAGLEDCYTVTREIFMNRQLLGMHCENITIMGDSAGGNLAAAVSLLARDRGEFEVGSQILIYPATYNNHSETSPFTSVHINGTDFLLTSKKICDYLSLYKRTDADLENYYFAPLLAKDLTNQPKTLIITAQYDPLRDEGEAYGKALRAAGNVCEYRCMRDALHGFLSLPPGFFHVHTAYRLINLFLRRIVQERSPESLFPDLPNYRKLDMEINTENKEEKE